MKKIISKLLTLIMVLSIAVPSIALASDASTVMKGKASDILGALAWFGYAIGIGMILYIGVKYTLAAANEKATLKQGVINYLIGAFLVIGASAVADFVSTVAMGDSAGSDLATSIIDAAENAANGNW